MPKGWGFNVTLQNCESGMFTEYGTSTLLTRADRRSRIVTTKVESKTDAKFCFRIQGVGPFLDFSEKDRGPRDLSQNASDMIKHPPLIGWAPYAICARILVDGKAHSSKNTLMYLTPHSSVMDPGVILDSCKIWSGVNEEGEDLFKDHDWVFADVGIEFRLAQLGLSGLNDGQGMDKVLPESSAPEDDIDGPSGSAGTIEVQLIRYIIRPKPSESTMRRSKRLPMNSRKTTSGAQGAESEVPDDDYSLSTGDDNSNVTHTVELVDQGKDGDTWDSVAGYYPDGASEPYARYRFQYMSLLKLVKIGVAHSDGSVVTPEERKTRNRQMALDQAAESRSKKSKKRSSDEEDCDHASTPDSMPKPTKSKDGEYGDGRRLIMPIRSRSDTQPRWLKSHNAKPLPDMLPVESTMKAGTVNEGQEYIERGLSSITLEPSDKHSERTGDGGKYVVTIEEAQEEDL